MEVGMEFSWGDLRSIAACSGLGWLRPASAAPFLTRQFGLVFYFQKQSELFWIHSDSQRRFASQFESPNLQLTVGPSGRWGPVGDHVQATFTSESDHCKLRRLGGCCLTRGRVCLVSSDLVFVKYTYLSTTKNFLTSNLVEPKLTTGRWRLAVRMLFFLPFMLFCVVLLSCLFSDTAYLDYIGLVLDE
jgi:hypothetical protein